MLINTPHVVEAVTAAFIDYERALLANELDTLDAYFWHSERTVRYGVAENLQGAENIARYRRHCRPVGPGRQLLRTLVSTFGEDFATVSTESPMASPRAWVGKCKPGCVWMVNGKWSLLTSAST
jgi:hypothetical protein